jgi:hypothetical protein
MTHQGLQQLGSLRFSDLRVLLAGYLYEILPVSVFGQLVHPLEYLLKFCSRYSFIITQINSPRALKDTQFLCC